MACLGQTGTGNESPGGIGRRDGIANKSYHNMIAGDIGEPGDVMPEGMDNASSALVAVQLAEHVGFRVLGLPTLATECRAAFRQSPNADKAHQKTMSKVYVTPDEAWPPRISEHIQAAAKLTVFHGLTAGIRERRYLAFGWSDEHALESVLRQSLQKAANMYFRLREQREFKRRGKNKTTMTKTMIAVIMYPVHCTVTSILSLTRWHCDDHFNPASQELTLISTPRGWCLATERRGFYPGCFTTTGFWKTISRQSPMLRPTRFNDDYTVRNPATVHDYPYSVKTGELKHAELAERFYLSRKRLVTGLSFTRRLGFLRYEQNYKLVDRLAVRVGGGRPGNSWLLG